MSSATAAPIQQKEGFDAPSPLLLPERLQANLENPDNISVLSSSSTDSSSSSSSLPSFTISAATTKPSSPFTPLPSRPSVLTNRMSPHNSIPKSDTRQSRRLLSRLPSVKNERSGNSRSHQARSSSGSSTPDLSRSNSTTTSTTPILSPESGTESLSSHSDLSMYKLGRKPSMESLTSSEHSNQFSCLAKDDQYLLHLKDVEGMSCWSDIAERMCQKGYPTQQRGLRTRYCILKRDLDLSLQRQMENLSNIQSEVDEHIGGTSCPVRRLASFKGKKMSSSLRVYDEEDETVDPQVWEALAASLQASGLR